MMCFGYSRDYFDYSEQKNAQVMGESLGTQ